MRKITMRQSITVIATLIVVLTGVAVVIAFRYFQSIPEAIPDKKVVHHQVSEKRSPVKSRTLSPDVDHYTDNLYAYSKQPDQKRGFISNRARYSRRHRDYIPPSYHEIRSQRKSTPGTYNPSTHWMSSSPSSDSLYSSSRSSTQSLRYNYNETGDTTPSSDYLNDSGEITEDQGLIEDQNLSQNDNAPPTDDNHAVTVSRKFVSGSFDEGKFEVTLSVSVNNPPNGLIVKEYIPEGWVVIESTPSYRNFNSSTGEIKWLFMGTDVKDMEIRYTAVKKDTTHSGSSFYGIYLYNDMNGEHITMQTGGEDRV